MTDAASPLTFTRGPAMANRMMLAPLTNLQSQVDGTLSDDEIKWLTMRAKGGMGLVMTAAAHVQRQGQGFQLGLVRTSPGDPEKGLGQAGERVQGHVVGLCLVRIIKANEACRDSACLKNSPGGLVTLSSRYRWA